MKFHNLSIQSIVNETEDAKTIFFTIPSSLKSEFSFKAGQYLTLQDSINGEEVRRAYSICTMPDSETIGVTIKKLENGKMSSYIHNNWATGQEKSVAAPDGNFTIEPDHYTQKNYFFITAGSGITPVMSMLSSVLEHEPLSKCYVLYGCRNENSIIFKNQLDEIIKKYEDQLFITYTLSQPNAEKSGGLFGMFKKQVISWQGETGRISEAKVASFLESYTIDKKHDSEFYLCGPGDMITSVEEYLTKIYVDKKKINKEFFSTSSSDKKEIASGSSQIKVTLNGETFIMTSNGKKPILDELIDMKKNPPYSCTSGACSSCMAKVVSGKVEMEVCYALDDQDIQNGLILTCQAKAVTPEVEIVFDGI
jgi:ring-1,2-phenylacetyl-CoA epoxidase subunit PaaE